MLKKACLISNTMLLLAIAAIIAVNVASQEQFEPEENKSIVSINEKIKETSNPLYCVKNTENAIGVYRYGETTASRIINVDFSELPDEDRRLLEKGVFIYSEEELHFFLEDYDAD